MYNNEEKRGHSRNIRLLALAVALCLIAGAFGICTALAEDKTTVLYESKRDNKDLEIVTVEPGELMTAAQIYKKNVNSTVGIRTEITQNYFGYTTPAATAGSGFIVSEDGYVVTNAHVVSGANKVTVSTFDGNSYEASIIGSDERNDLAVLKIEAEGLQPVVLGSSSAIEIGDPVVAIGNPLGELTFSLTTGIISAKDREITLSSGTQMSLLQTDCAINSGNSGGAMFNMYGEVVGITNAKYSSSSSGASVDNIAFAVPMDQVKPIIKSIIETGRYIRPYIGVTVSDVSDEMKNYGIPGGAVIKTVTEDGPAKEAGLQPNDIITSVNGTEMAGYAQFSRFISTCSVGDVLTLTVYRQGQTIEITVTVGEYQEPVVEEQPQQQTQQQPSAPYGYGNGGSMFGNGNDLWDYFFGGNGLYGRRW